MSVQASPTPIQLGVQGGITANYNEQTYDSESLLSAYGHLYSFAGQEVPEESRVMDYYKEKENRFISLTQKKVPNK